MMNGKSCTLTGYDPVERDLSWLSLFRVGHVSISGVKYNQWLALATYTTKNWEMGANFVKSSGSGGGKGMHILWIIRMLYKVSAESIISRSNPWVSTECESPNRDKHSSGEHDITSNLLGRVAGDYIWRNLKYHLLWYFSSTVLYKSQNSLMIFLLITL